jgi:sulfur relay (sulfurtransferase) complex TusBCD TusD component (DsrE family)
MVQKSGRMLKYESERRRTMQKLLFILSKGFEKSGGATRAVQFAAIAAGKGHEVEVFLIDDAIHWAQLGMAEGIRSSTGEHMKDLLDELIARETTIHVCKACADKRLVSPDELIKGAKISGAPVLVDMMTDPEYKVFTF